MKTRRLQLWSGPDSEARGGPRTYRVQRCRERGRGSGKSLATLWQTHLNPGWRVYRCVLNCNCHLIRLMITNNTTDVLPFLWDDDTADPPSRRELGRARSSLSSPPPACDSGPSSQVPGTGLRGLCHSDPRIRPESAPELRDQACPPPTQRGLCTAGTHMLDGRKDKRVVGTRTVGEMDTLQKVMDRDPTPPPAPFSWTKCTRSSSVRALKYVPSSRSGPA